VKKGSKLTTPQRHNRLTPARKPPYRARLNTNRITAQSATVVAMSR
jgi:hypothetical protein